MYQHQRAPLPLEQLKGLPQPVVVLLEKLLEKDPAHRFQTPTELLKTMPTITGAIYVRRKITRQSLLQTPPTVTRILSRKPRCKTHRIIVACSVKSKRSACPPSIVCALRPSPSGISERPTLAKRPWREPSHWPKTLMICPHWPWHYFLPRISPTLRVIGLKWNDWH